MVDADTGADVVVSAVLIVVALSFHRSKGGERRSKRRRPCGSGRRRCECGGGGEGEEERLGFLQWGGGLE
jgi:hypothetical protein